MWYGTNTEFETRRLQPHVKDINVGLAFVVWGATSTNTVAKCRSRHSGHCGSKVTSQIICNYHFGISRGRSVDPRLPR